MAKPEAAPSKKRSGIVGISILLVVTIIVNIACMLFYSGINTFMTANLNAKLSGNKSTSAAILSTEEAAENAKAMVKEIEAEGAVLLKNDDAALPLASGTHINLFGYATVDPIYGGSGSGASDTSSNIDLVQGLKDAGFEVNQDLIDFYKKSGVSRVSQTGFSGSNFTPAEVEASAYTDELLSSAREYADTAIVMFSRVGGEGGDLPTDMYAAKYSDTDDGRHYLELTQDEEDLLELVKSQNYEHVIVLVNSVNAMELGFLEDDSIDAALWVGGPGYNGFDAVGEILAGTVNPSGRLTDTYAYDVTSAPSYWNTGDFTYSNLKKRNYVEYVEGIYVGYRYYETRYIDNATGECDEAAYAKTVQYPFGYGLSYTTFTQEIANYSADADTITVEVKVTNTGDAAGKEVVQVYYTAPYTVGGIEKAHVVLAGFGKTEPLQPGESETVTITFKPEDMASYDYTGSGCYVLEAGDYEIKLMANAHEVIDSRTYTVDSTITYDESNPRSTDETAAVNQFDEVGSEQITQYVSRADWEGTLPTERVDSKAASDATAAAYSNKAAYAVDDSDEAITFADNGLTLSDMAGLDYDDEKWSQLLEQLSVNDMVNMISNGGWSTPEITSVGKPATNDLDGPSGINSLVSDLKGVSYPVEVVLGSGWNTDLAYRFGQTYGAEAAANNVAGLYAPGANIHRSPFSGRNFEYYSEDGLLSGKMAAGVVEGAAENGVYCYVKHFALNDQESNRLSISVWCNEQAMRELYFKPFEIAVKEGGTTAIMSSYSNIGTTWAGACSALLQTVLRDEWGFTGMVVTDSAMGNTSWMDANLAIRNGGDMMLCQIGVNIDTSSNTAQQAMRRACHNILYTQANSVAIAVAVDTTPYWLWLLAALDIITLSVLAMFIAKRVKPDKKLSTPVRVAIVAVIAVAVCLVFWFKFFANSGVKAATTAAEDLFAGGSSSEATASSGAAETATDEDLYMELRGTGDGDKAWLTAHISLQNDGRYVLYFDYNADNSNIQADTGTWSEENGTITFTADALDDMTATGTDNGDGTMTYTMDVTNAETAIVCHLTGTLGGAATSSTGTVEVQTPTDDTYCELRGTGNGGKAWLIGHITLGTDGRYVLYFDYNADNANIQADTGTWETAEDGSLVLTADSRDDMTAVAVDNGNGTVTYTVDVLNSETGITCTLTATVKQAE